MTKKILIVDDEEPVRKMICSMLKTKGYEILEAANGAEAREICDENSIELVITDIVMPEKHGIDLIMELQKDFPDIHVIAISGGGGITGRFDYLDIAEIVGADNILRKPFTAEDLRHTVSSILENTV